MTDVIITRRGGGGFSGGGAAFGAIETEYPAGSICTCTGLSRGRKLKAGDTSGKLVFAVPYADTWTVLAVDGENSVSKTAIISDSERYKMLQLSLEKLYFNSGNPADYTGGWDDCFDIGENLTLSINANASSTYDTGIYGTSKKKISLADIDRLTINVTELSGCDRAFFYFADDNGGGMGIYAIPTPDLLWNLDEGENIIDVSAYDGSYYFAFCIVEAKGSDEVAYMELNRIAGN